MKTSDLTRLSLLLSSIGFITACASTQEEPLANATQTPVHWGSSGGLSRAGGELRKSARFNMLSQKIQFELGSSELSAANRRTLDEMAMEMKKSADSFDKIRIEGLTDAQGDIQRNQRLSEARAQSVRNYLISQGVPPAKLEAVGRGTVANDMDDQRQRAADRRVDFEIVE